LTIDRAATANLRWDRGYYQPTRLLPLRKMLRVISTAPRTDGALVDFGCGKGRVLLVASEFGFERVRGVELAHELCEIARENCAAYKAKTGITTDFKVVESDATRYAVKEDETLFFLFNPFGRKVLSTVLDNIALSLREHPRRALIAYCNPRWKQSIEQRTDFFLVQELNFWRHRFAIFANRLHDPSQVPEFLPVQSQ